MKKSTLFSHIARPKVGKGTAVNPPITRASTLLFENSSDLYDRDIRSYGRHGAGVHDALKEAFLALEGGEYCALTASGLAANTLSILSCVRAGDHILVSDSAYGPVHHFCKTILKRMNVEAEFYPPNIGAKIEDLFRDNTRLVALESPGSLTMEIQDLPTIAKLARARGITTIVDNTWSAGLVYNPLTLGADIVVHAATKFYSGHSDVLYGAVIAADQKHGQMIDTTNKAMGNATSPDDAYLILRGFRTVVTRFEAQAKTAKTLADYLAGHNKVAKVLHPARGDHPQHGLWKRDFTGAGALFSAVLKPCAEAQVYALLDRMKLFAKGYSFGGFESLVIYCDPNLSRRFDPGFEGPLVRFACGLEDANDLQADLKQALDGLQLS